MYLDSAMVHWTMAMNDRATGWLDDDSHARVRELLLHMACVYKLLVPVYCLMPDHLHILMVGTAFESDQRKAVAFFRRYLNEMLLSRQSAALQKQAYDHVLKEAERQRGAFQATAYYILENPVRKGLVEIAEKWAYSGCVVAGRPGWNVFHQEYWGSFWRAFEQHAGGGDKAHV